MSTNNFPRVSEILRRIPGAEKKWPEWFRCFCPCGARCRPTDTHCGDSNEKITPIYRFDPITDGDSPDRWHGSDTDPRNMHHLWSMLEAVDDHNNPQLGGGEACVQRGGLLIFGTDPNPIEAMLRCLEEATR